MTTSGSGASPSSPGAAGGTSAGSDVADEQSALDILESITDGFLAIDDAWRFTYLNRQAVRLLDRRPGDLLGQNIWEAYPGLLDTEFERASRRTAQQRTPSSVTAFYPDHQRWYEVHVYPARRGISIYFRDVTDAHRAEQELRESEERHRFAAAAAASAAEANAKFRVFFEQGTQFAGVLTLDGIVVEANHLCLDFCGFTREEVLGQPFWSCGWWNRSPRLMELVREAVGQAASGRVFRTETQYFVADGTQRVVDLVIAPVVNDANEVLFVAATGTDITDRVRSEAATRERDARFRIMADSAPVLIWQTDASGVSFMNRQYLAFFGRSASELTGMQWADYLHRADLAYIETYRRAFAQQQPYEMQARFRRHDGEYRWLQNVALPHIDDEGNFLGFMGCSVDVSNLRDLEVALETIEQRAAAKSAELDRIMANVGEGFVVLDRDFRYIYANDAAEQLVGLTREEALGRTPWELFPPDVVRDARRCMEEAFATGRMVQYEVYVPGLDRWYENRVYPSGDSLSLFFSDITHRKRAEATIRENRDVLALAMRGGRMGAWSRNLVTDAVWWSRELEELFGLEPGGFAGTEDGFLAFVHEDDRPILTAAVGDAIARHQDYVIEFRIRTQAGEWRWMDGRGRAVYDDTGRPAMLYGLGIDITERKRAEEALARARDAAEAANQLKDQFLATLSHELRTPLNAILGYARMLRSNAIQTEKRDRALEVIERNAFAQTQLVEDLLDISRITTGKVRLDPQPVLAAAPLREALETIRPAVDAKRIALDTDIDPFAGSVHADVTRLQQVFWNLLANAVKFTPSGGRITVSLRQLDDVVEVSVSDTGIGVSPDFLPYVFQPFRQADAGVSRGHGGLGLGLAICKQLVELHGGTIAAASDGPGQGARFTVRLPRHSDLLHMS